MDQRNANRRSRSGAAKRAAPRSAKPAKRSADLPDLESVLGRFSDAMSLLAVVHRSLTAQEFAGVGDEEITLRRAIEELKSVYDEIDAVVPLLRSGAAVRLEAAEPDDYK